MGESTIRCKCGEVLHISAYLNADLQLICDDLAAKLAAAEKERDEARAEFVKATLDLLQARDAARWYYREATSFEEMPSDEKNVARWPWLKEVGDDSSTKD